jgi:hypothetical protein
MKISNRVLTVGRRRVWRGLMAGALGLQVSCVTVDVPPATPSTDVRDQLGSVAIVPARYAPQTDFLISWRHKEGATGKQAALTAAGMAAATTAAATSWLGPVAVFTGAIAGGAAVVREALGTAQGIVPASTATELESAISTAVAGRDVQTALAGQLAKMVEAAPGVRLATVSAAGPAAPLTPPDYAQLRTTGVDAVVETAISEIGFEGCISHNWECPPPHVLYLFMHAQARLVRVEDGAVLFERGLEYKSGHHELAYWLTDDGRWLGEELEQADRALSERVYDEVFLITPFELPNSRGTDCWLQPLFPKFDMIHGSRVDTLQPTLRWTAFPRHVDREELDPAILSRISDVTYDLRIWDESTNAGNGAPLERWRNRVVYERSRLEARSTRWRIRWRLAAVTTGRCARGSWSTVARWRRAGPVGVVASRTKCGSGSMKWTRRNGEVPVLRLLFRDAGWVAVCTLHASHRGRLSCPTSRSSMPISLPSGTDRVAARG